MLACEKIEAHVGRLGMDDPCVTEAPSSAAAPAGETAEEIAAPESPPTCTCRDLLQRAAAERDRARRKPRNGANDADDEVACLERAVALAMAPLARPDCDIGGAACGKSLTHGLPGTVNALPLDFDLGACFLAHARLARCYWRQRTSVVDDDADKDGAQGDDRTRAVACTALAAYHLAFPHDDDDDDGTETVTVDGMALPLETLMQGLTALMGTLAAPPALSVSNTSSDSYTYSVRALKDVRNDLRMRGELDDTPAELRAYRTIVDVICDDEGDAATTFVNGARSSREHFIKPQHHKKGAVVGPNSKQRRQEQRRLKFGHTGETVGVAEAKSVPEGT